MLGVLSAMLCCGAVSAQQHEVEMIPFGNMDQWIDRQIKESGIIRQITWQVGYIGGYSSYIGFDKRNQNAVVVLQNSFNWSNYLGHTILSQLARR